MDEKSDTHPIGGSKTYQENDPVSRMKKANQEAFAVSKEGFPTPLTNGSGIQNDSWGSMSPISGSTFDSILRTEEAELAAVIAKVTGRVSPYVNESDGGKRKFTILCGEAANHNAAGGGGSGGSDDGLSSPLSTLSPLSPPLVPPTSPEFHEDSKLLLDVLSSKGILVNCIGDRVGSVDSGIETGEGLATNGGIFENHTTPESQDGAKIIIKEIEEKPSEMTSNIEIKSRQLDSATAKVVKVENGSVAKKGDATPEKNAVGNSPTEYQSPNSIDKVPDGGNDSQKLETPKHDQIEEEIEPKTTTVKACFPSVKSKVPMKRSFGVESPEIQQNIINRRMAARSATAMAEFDPLVTMSPEAQKLAMWTDKKSQEKKNIYEPDGDPSPDKNDVVPKTSVVVSALHKPTSDGKDATDSSQEIDSQKHPELQPSTNTELSKDDDVTDKKPRSKLDSELGDDDDDDGDHVKKVIGYGGYIKRRSVVSLALVVLIPLAIFIPLMLINFAGPLWEREPIKIVGGHEETAKDSPEANHVLQDLLKAQKEKMELDGFVEYSEEDHSGGISNLEMAAYNYLNSDTEHSSEETDGFHGGDDFEYGMTSSSGKFKDNVLSHAFHPKQNYITICSSFEDDKDKITCQKMKPSVLKLVWKYGKRCQSYGDIILTDYIQMYRYLNSFLSGLGGFVSVQTKMLEERLEQLEMLTLGDKGLDHQKLFQMIYSEVASGVVGEMEPFSGTILFTCLHRHLQFLTLALEEMLSIKSEESLQLAFETAYKKILSSHHTWFVEMIYEIGMNVLPTKELAATLLSIRQAEKFSLDELQESMEVVIAEFKTLIDTAEDVLVQTNALEVIPRQVIT